jgi:hypothetical protein
MATATTMRQVIPWPSDQDALAFIKRLHRGTDSAVCLARKVAGKWEELGTVPVATLDRLPKIGDEDVYASINSTVIREGYLGHGVHPETGLIKTGRKSHQMFWLNCAHVDIDSPKVNLSADAAYSQAIQYLLEHGLPLPTIVIFSGNGVWLIWEFRLPVNGDPDRRSLLWRVNANLQGRFAHLGADPKSKDVARVCRVMGSMNTSAGKRVNWNEVPNGKPVDLNFLAASLEVPAQKTAITKAEEKKPVTARNPIRRAAGYTRWTSRRLDLLMLLEHRGTLAEGQRHDFLFYLSAVSKCAGIPARDIRKECLEIGQTRCMPAYSGLEVERAVSGGLSTIHNITDERIRLSGIAITQAECSALNLAVGRIKRAKRNISKRAEIQDRRRLVKSLTAEGYIPLRQMAILLRERGFNVERGTVAKDYRFLGISKTGSRNTRGRSDAARAFPLRGDQDQEFVHFCAHRTSLPNTPAQKWTEKIGGRIQ